MSAVIYNIFYLLYVLYMFVVDLKRTNVFFFQSALSHREIPKFQELFD